MRGAGLLIAFGWCVAFAMPALACEPATVPKSELDNPIDQNADGSFSVSDLRGAYQNSNSDGYFGSYVSGNKPTDIGSGRVGQKITAGSGCGSAEYLLFMDCTNGEAIRVAGAPDENYNIAGAYLAAIRLIQPPYGPIALRATTTVVEVEAIARANDYEYTRDVMADVNNMIRPQRYDPFIGCKIFYPESPGAKM
jgi:hypothetical protein